jgi:hypothetical protein
MDGQKCKFLTIFFYNSISDYPVSLRRDKSLMDPCD